MPWRCHVFQVVLQALAQAQPCPREIVVQNRDVDEEGHPAWVFNDLDLLMSEHELSGIAQNLRVLRLYRVWSDYSHNGDKVLNLQMHSGALGRFIECAPQLEELTLHFVDRCKVPIEDIMGGSRLPRLRIVSLTNVVFEVTVLESWLAGHSKTLEYIWLDRVVLALGHWISMLDMMRQQDFAQLRNLILLDVYTTGEEGARMLGEDPVCDPHYWGWELEQGLLSDYIRRTTDTNPYIAYCKDCFPSL